MSLPETVMSILLFGVVQIIVLAVAAEIIKPLVEKRRKREEREKERELPVYERVARAQERRAEVRLEAGGFWDAKRLFKEAKKLREEATEAIINGEEPPL